MSAFNTYRVTRQMSFESSTTAADKSVSFGAGTATLPMKRGLEAGNSDEPQEDGGEETQQIWGQSAVTVADLGCSPSFNGMKMGASKPKPAPAPLDPELLTTDHHDYVREFCVVPPSSLTTFDDLVGVSQVVAFAQEYLPSVQGAVRAVSGLLLFGSSGTGKTACAQAIAHYIGGTFYKFSAADLPTGQHQAQRINALFDVAQAGCKPAVIFIDEVDTLLSARATVRVGHFAGRFERFMEGVLVIGATNSPQKIAPKILSGRFERKILVNPPSAAARQMLISKQLAQEEQEHTLTRADMRYILEQTDGRSAVNMERLVSTAVGRGGGLAVGKSDFMLALEEERSDFDEEVAGQNAEYNCKHGWRGGR